MRLSIRWRLTLWNALALAVVLAGFAALVYGLLAHALYQQTDRKLLGGFHELEDDPRLESDPEGQMRHWAFELYEHAGVLCVAYGPGGEVRCDSQECRSPPSPRRRGPRSPARTSTTRSFPASAASAILEGQFRLGGQDAAVLLMVPLAEVDRELGRLLAVLGMAVPAALACSCGLGYLLARAALAPVERLRRSTREITADRLDRRLPVVNPGDELGAGRTPSTR